MKKVRDFMNRRVIYFSPNNTILDIMQKLAENDISGAPIVENGRLVGIITDSDIVRFVNEKLYKDKTDVNSTTSCLIMNTGRFLGRGKDKKDVESVMGTKVSEVMTREVVFVTPDTDIPEVVDIMIDKGINRLPVMERGNLVGIVARNDLIKAFR